ncbi:transposable element Tcb1 transposase [Trichonephila clavipes]|nr:transposable element Tcb1 transposase [Trichonephila clavipes]
MSAHTIRRNLQQSGMSASPLLRLSLSGNHRRLHRNEAMNSTWATEWNDIVVTDESRFCLKHYDGRICVWRHRGERLLNCSVMHRPLVQHPVSCLGVVLDFTATLL